MVTRVILQSRISSSRLPAKGMLTTVRGLPVVALAALRAGTTGHQVVVATSVDATDDVIASAVRSVKVPVFRGSLDDTLDRFVQATADLAPDDLVVRLTGDNVVPNGEFVDEVIAHMRAHDEQYVRVTTEGIYGMGAEAFTVELLRQAATSDSPYDHEHVTPWIRRHTADLTYVPQIPEELGTVRCTIDTLRDYIFASKALATFDDPVQASWRDLLAAWHQVGASRPALALAPRPNPIGQGRWILRVDQGGRDVAGAMEASVQHGITHLDIIGEQALNTTGRLFAHGLSEVSKLTLLLDPFKAPADAAAGWHQTEVVAAVERALRLMKGGSVDGLLTHSVTDWHRSGVADAMHQVKAEGLAKVIGATAHTRAEFEQSLGMVDYVRAPLNIITSAPFAAPERTIVVAIAPDYELTTALQVPGVTSVETQATTIEMLDHLGSQISEAIEAAEQPKR